MIMKPPGQSRLRVGLAQLCARFVKAKCATAIEYALIASGIGAAVAATVWSVGSSLKANFYDSLAAMF
jgi:Flp pilus assembly pilin Flp